MLFFIVGGGFSRMAMAHEEMDPLRGEEKGTSTGQDDRSRTEGLSAEKKLTGSGESGMSVFGGDDSLAQTPSSVQTHRGSSFLHSPYSPYMSSGYISVTSSHALQNFQEMSSDLDIEDHHILTKLESGAFLVKSPIASAREVTGSDHRGIVEDFKNALIEKYGDKIAEHVFLAHTKEAEVSGLTFRKIRHVIQEAEKNWKLQQDQQPERGALDGTGSRFSLGSAGALGEDVVEDKGPRRRSIEWWNIVRNGVVKKGMSTEQRSKGPAMRMGDVVVQAVAQEAPFKARREATQAANELRERGFSMLHEIETKTQEELEKVESTCTSQYDRIRTKAAVARAIGNFPDAATERKKRSEVTKAAFHGQVEVFFQAEYPRNHAERRIVSSFLRRRYFLSRVLERNQTCVALEEIDKISTDLLTSIAAEENRSDEISLLTMVTLRVAEAMQFFVLGCGTQNAIRTATMDLAAAKRLLTEARIGGNDQSLFSGPLQLLDSASNAFYFAQSQSPRVAVAEAQKNATAIRNALEAIKQRIKLNKGLLDSVETDSAGKEKATERVKMLEKISKSLEIAAFAYEQLRDENEIERTTGQLLSLKERIETRITNLTDLNSRNMTNSRSMILIVSALEALYNNFLTLAETLEDEYSQPQNPSEFLDELDQIKEEQNRDKIIGANGKIALFENKDLSRSFALEKASSASSSSAAPVFSDEEKKAWREGIDLIRFGLCRNFNIRAVQRFDEEFQDKFVEGNSLSVGELKTFITKEKVLHASSHFMSPPDDIEDFMERLSRAEENKVVKWDERTMSFNPFAGDLPGLEEGDSREIDKQEIAAGRAQARKAIENIFTKASVPEEEMTEILERFDLQFPPIDLQSQERITAAELGKLTVRELRSFIEKETAGTNVDSRSFLSRFVITSKMLEGANYGIGSVLAAAVAGALLHTYIPLAIHAAPGAWHAFEHWVSGAGAAAGSAR